MYVPAPKQSDDELYVLSQNMKPYHAKFASMVAGGMMGTEAIRALGYQGVAPKQAASQILRRPDVVAFIRLSQARMVGAAQVTQAAILDRLWAMATDPLASAASRDKAMSHLVKLQAAGISAAAKAPAETAAPVQVAAPDEGLAELERVAEDLQARKAPLQEPSQEGPSTEGP